MRPARKGPENPSPDDDSAAVGGVPSMRPARKGPENRAVRAAGLPSASSFNEAGPQGAGKPRPNKGRR